MKIGIIQGRLSEPKEGFQECPINWRREFNLLSPLGLSHIEWIVTKKNYWSNPIFSTQNIDISQVSSVCADFFVDKLFENFTLLKNYMSPFCNAVSDQGIINITIPLLENSSVENRGVRTAFIDFILSYSETFPHLNFSFEAELGHKELLEIVSLADNFYVTYDTGNMTSFGADHSEYIQAVGHKINNVHLKDRTYNAETVSPGKGDTNFQLIFKELKKIGYNGNYTIQAARDEQGKEIETISNHKKFFEELQSE